MREMRVRVTAKVFLTPGARSAWLQGRDLTGILAGILEVIARFPANASTVPIKYPSSTK
jgi:hypothetical protein